MIFPHNSQKLLIPLLTAALCLSFAAPKVGAEAPAKKVPSQRLNITAVQDESAPCVNVPMDEIDPGNQASLTYVDLKEVSLKTAQGEKPLEAAIQDGDISVEEIFAYARLDARNGFCTEHKSSLHGLTHFIYVYPKYKLYAAYDLYETPDGKQNLINELTFASRNSNLTFTYEELDQEDWGLTFAVSQADGKSVTIDCTQKGGQQAGTLILDYFHIYLEDYSEVKPAKNITGTEDFQPKIPLPMNASDSFTIRWENLYGALPKGKYRMDLHVQDEYDKNKLHPLQDKFHDSQRYWVSFEVN